MIKSNVVKLSPADFSGATLPKYKNKLVFVKFFAPWCGYCNNVAPIYEDLATQYKKNNKVIIAEIDCDTYTQFHNDFNLFSNTPKVEGFPTFLLFINGGTIIKKYDDIRDVEHFINFINQYY